MRSVFGLRPAAAALLLWAVGAPLSSGCLWAQEPPALFLWTVSGDSATVHLTGSIHVGRPDFFPLADPLQEAFEQADALAVEVNVSDPAALQKMSALIMKEGMLPAGETLQDRLSEEVYARLEAVAAARDLPLAMFQTFKPGLVTLSLVALEYQRLGYDPNLGIDTHFLTAANECGKEILELESIEQQFDLFIKIDDQLDDVFLAEFLDQLGDLEAITAKMIDLWRSADVAGLTDFIEEQVGSDPAMLAFYDELMDQRNVKMVATLDQWLKGSKDIFVVVGAGHFGGDQGILNLLEQKGWSVEQCTMATAP